MIGRLDRAVARALKGLHQSIDARGRVRVVVPLGHPLRRFANDSGWNWRNRIVQMIVLGRRLPTWVQVHHLNKRRDDDRIRNHSRLGTKAHARLHAELRRGKR